MKTCKRCSRDFPATTEYFHLVTATGELHDLCKSCLYAPKKDRYIPPLGYKYCSKCGKDLPATPEFFSRDKNRPDGLYTNCKPCVKQWRDENALMIKEGSAKYREARREEARQATQEWRENNRDRDRANSNNWRKNNPKRAKLRTHRYNTRKLNLPIDFNHEDWIATLAAFGGCCAVCGRPSGLWHTLAMDHWIPITAPECPGTVPHNIVPLCHGQDGCNNSKHDINPKEWLVSKLGKRKGKRKFDEIQSYLDKVKR